MKRWINNKPVGFVEDFESNESKVLIEGYIPIELNKKTAFAVREGVLVKQME